jgi:type IX secretion system substrate protein
LTVKNYHVANTLLPSQIRKVVLWSKTPGLIFTGAQSAPTNWTKRVSAAGDSVIYTANHDSAALASSKVSSLFRFSVDPPTSDAFKIGWRTFRTLTDPLSTGEMQLQCSEQPPLQDVATIESVDECSWNIRITNQHNTPASSDLYAIDLSIPAGSGTLTTFASSLAWTKTNETATSVRYVAPSGAQQGSNSQQSILFSINPQTPGQPVVLTWKTYDEASLQSNTPLKADTFQLTCSPVVVLCDLVSALTEPGPDTCMQNFTIKSQRTVALTGVTIEPRNGWKIDSVIAPAGWDAQLDANKTLVNFTNSTGIAPEGSQGDFRVMFAAIDQSDTFGVKVTTADVSSRECDTTLTFTCTSGTSGAVNEIVFNPDQVNVVPNPVSQNATIELTINDQSRIRMTLLDVLGHQVADIANKMMQPGTYSIPLQMGGLSAGTYYLRVQSYYGVVTKKIVLTN